MQHQLARVIDLLPDELSVTNLPTNNHAKQQATEGNCNITESSNTHLPPIIMQNNKQQKLALILQKVALVGNNKVTTLPTNNHEKQQATEASCNITD